MKYDSFFDTEENKTLTAICTRRLIRNIGIGGIIWGMINLLIGIEAIQVTMLNAGILILGVLMLITGVQALRKPSFEILKAETIVTALLFLWNVGISVLNLIATGKTNGYLIIIPLIITITFAKFYKKLGHLREQIDSIEPEKIQATKQMCKALIKIKLKNEPTVIETKNRRCRVKFMDKTALFIQRDLMRAFVATKEEIYEAIKNPNAKSFTLQFNHPVGKLTYYFDRKNSQKLKTWLSSESTPADESTETTQEISTAQPEAVLSN